MVNTPEHIGREGAEPSVWNLLREKFARWFESAGDSRERDQSRRDFLALASALVAVIAIPGLSACEREAIPQEMAPTEITPPPHRRIDFLGTTIEILDEAKFQKMYDMALQYLLLKFSTPGKIIDGETDEKRDETKDEYWHRAIELDFREVLCRMERYEAMTYRYGTEMGFNDDVLSYFGIEAGFDPLKRSHSGYCGLGQIGDEAVADIRDKSPIDADLKIQSAQMNPWYDLRYDPKYGIPNGVAYLQLLRDDFPKTVQNLLSRFRVQIKSWLEAKTNAKTDETRLDAIEKQLRITKNKEASYEDRYKQITSLIMPPNDIAIADPTSFAIHAYNMGIAGVAKLVFLNFLDAHNRDVSLITDSGISVFNLDSSMDPDSVINALGLDMGHQLRSTDTQSAQTERQTYLWQALVFKELMSEWFALQRGQSMTVRFKDHDYELTRPADEPLDYEREIDEDTIEIDVPAGLDLVKFAEHLSPDDDRAHESFRLKGNAAFVRAGAYYGNPNDHKSGNVKVRIPKTKEVQAGAYLANTPSLVRIYKLKKGDTSSKILRRMLKKNPGMKNITYDRIFWSYNRIGRSAVLRAGDLLALPSEIEI